MGCKNGTLRNSQSPDATPHFSPRLNLKAVIASDSSAAVEGGEELSSSPTPGEVRAAHNWSVPTPAGDTDVKITFVLFHALFKG